MPTTRPRADSSDNESCKPSLLHVHFGIFRCQIDWAHWLVKALLFALLVPHLLLGWWLLSPWSGAWSSEPNHSPSVDHAELAEYFQTFSGTTECGISLLELHVSPKKDHKGKFPRGSFCPNRKTLLEAMTGGGRHGFDAPYFPKGCHHRWYSVDEICMILERFDSLVFIGDDTLQTIYGGLNILLRQDLALGALNPSDLTPGDLTSCRCDNQLIKATCSKHALTSSDQVPGGVPNPYLCTRTPHAFLPISGSPFSPSTLKSLRTLVPPAPPSNYHPIPLIISLTPPGPGQPPSTPLATATLTSLLTFADSTSRKTPILWLGPPAAGHLDISGGRVSNNDLWRFGEEMERVCWERDVEWLGLWNMTVQAGSWDGRRFGERVALAQAMMVVNWLSRLESS